MSSSERRTFEQTRISAGWMSRRQRKDTLLGDIPELTPNELAETILDLEDQLERGLDLLEELHSTHDKTAAELQELQSLYEDLLQESKDAQTELTAKTAELTDAQDELARLRPLCVLLNYHNDS